MRAAHAPFSKRSFDPVDDRPRFLVTAFWCALLLTALGFIGTWGLSARVDLSTIIRLLGSPPDTAAAATERPVWGPAKVFATGANASAGAHQLCTAESRYFAGPKSTEERIDGTSTFRAGQPTVSLSNGQVLSLESGGYAQFVPFAGSEPDPELEREIRKQTAWYKGTTLLMQCLDARERLFVDGCILPPATPGGLPVLGACTQAASDRANGLVLTRGGRGTRLAEAMRSVLGVLVCTLLVLWVLLMIVASRLRGSSTEYREVLSQALKSTTRIQPEMDPKWWRFTPMLVVSLLVVTMALFGPVPMSAAILSLCWPLPTLAALYAFSMLKPRLLQAMRELPTSPLASAAGDVVALAVRVSPDAPTTAAPLSLTPAAHVTLQVWRRVERFRPKGINEIEYKPMHDTIVFGHSLPVLDDSSNATLYVANTFRDLPATEARYERTEIPSTITRTVGPILEPGDYLVRESVILPGDPLYLLGRVTRAADPAAADQGAYRDARTLPRIGADVDASQSDGTPNQKPSPLFVHVGTKASLLARSSRSMIREAFFVCIFAGSTGVSLAGALLAAYLCAR